MVRRGRAPNNGQRPRVTACDDITVAGSCNWGSFSGWLGYELFVGVDMKQFWGESIFILPTNTAMENAHHVPSWVKFLPDCVSSQWRLRLHFVLWLFDLNAGKNCCSISPVIFAVFQQMVF